MRTNPRTRNISPDDCMHDVADLARMLGAGIPETVAMLHILDATGHLKLVRDKRAPKCFSRFTVTGFDIKTLMRNIIDGVRFQDLKDILGINGDDDDRA